MNTTQPQTLVLTVGDDGKVEIPGTRPGQRVSLTLREGSIGSRPLTDEERRVMREELTKLRRKWRAESTPEEIDRAINHGDWLYDEHGLPR
jgi:hypothetical protein